jgi:hypothetical protein
MGEAKSRGTPEQRAARAVLDEMLDKSEVLIGLSVTDKHVNIKCLPRDAEPDQESLAIIVASFINANFGGLVETAMQAKKDFEAAQAAGQQNAHFIKQRPVRSITTPEGGLATKDAKIVGPDGNPLQ